MAKSNSYALLPLDNRPVSYLLPKQIAEFSGFNLILPERKFLGDLKKSADLNHIEKWMNNLPDVQAFILSLDTWNYGGLVQSRKHGFKLEDLKSRVGAFRGKPLQKEIPIYATSSILRIANYDSDEEEPPYWKEYGKKIFKWSELMYRVGKGIKKDNSSNDELLEDWYQATKEIPNNILLDYKSLRDKNLEINLSWLELLHRDIFKYLIYSSDDTSQFGINLTEAEYLKKQIEKHNLTNKARTLCGTDEVLLLLLTKAVLDFETTKPSVSLYFNSNAGKTKIARYESNTIYKSVLDNIETLELELQEDSEIVLCIHLSDGIQGDHIFKTKTEYTKINALKMQEFLENTNKPFIIFDLAYANGGDPELINALLKAKINWDLCYGYSGWNTASNTIGSALGIGINRWLSEKKKTFDKELFKQCLLLRFLDDFVYQAELRHECKTEEEINDKIKSYVHVFSELLGLNDINVKCKLPWKRSFEIEIKLNVLQTKNTK